MAIEVNLSTPDVVSVELGEFKLIPGPRGETGERGPRGYGVESAVLNPDFTLTLRFEDGSSYTTSSIRGEIGVSVSEAEIVPGDYDVSPYDTLKITFTDGQTKELKLYNAAAESQKAAAGSAGEAAGSAETAKQYSGKPPQIGEDGNWETWDAESGAYVTTGKPARGETGPIGPVGPTGPRGETGLTGETGERGPQGETGAPAGFGDIVATVDGESGVPSVEVSASGPDTEKAFTFAFHGLKGERGETGPVGPEGPRGETGPEGPPGKDGTGDMEAAVYDPEGKGTDIFKYVDDAVAKAQPKGEYLPANNPSFTGNLTHTGKGGISVGDSTSTAHMVSNAFSIELHEPQIAAVAVGFEIIENAGVVNITPASPELSLEDGAVIRGVHTPLERTDAANKQYVDDETAKYLPLSGGRLTGDLTIYKERGNIQVVGTGQAANYKGNGIYISGGTEFTLSGGTGPDPVDVRLGGIADPEAENDAANKGYVDKAVAALRRELGLS